MTTLYRMVCFLSALAATQAAEDKTHTKLPSFYHTSAQLDAELDRLTHKCPGWSREKRKDPQGAGPELDVIRIQLPHKTSKAVGDRVAMVFGEHARELITVDSSLHFMKALCGEIDVPTGLSLMEKDNGEGESASENDGDSLSESVSSPASAVSALLGDSVSELLIFPNANPTSRKVVEEGDFCERLNPNGVDLNRNWDAHWIAKDVSKWQDAPSGMKPFSEPESRIIRDTLAEYKPTFFLSVHSGNLGVFAPYAYNKNAPQPTPGTMSLLEKVSRQYCQCPFGGAAHTIGYNCPGASVDYVYDTLKAPNSYAVEIWIGEDEQQPFHDRYEAQIAGESASGLSSFLQQRHKRHALIKQHKDNSAEHGHDADWCLQNFNPTEHDDYQDVMKRWTQAYLTMIKEAPKDHADVAHKMVENGVHRTM